MKTHNIESLTTSYHDYLMKTLQDKKEASLYIQVALDEYQEDGDTEVLLLAFRNVAEAQGGVGKLAQKTHLNRVSLYRTLSSKGNPKLYTLGLLLRGLGFHLCIEPA